MNSSQSKVFKSSQKAIIISQSVIKAIGNDFHENVVLCGDKSIDTHGIIVVSFHNSKLNIGCVRVN
jgi:hypothetical protein